MKLRVVQHAQAPRGEVLERPVDGGQPPCRLAAQGHSDRVDGEVAALRSSSLLPGLTSGRAPGAG